MISTLFLPGFSEITISENADLKNNGLYNSFEIDIELFEALTTKYNSCFALTLQFVVKNCLKEVWQLDITLGKVSKLICFMYKMTIATAVLEGKKIRI